MLLTIGSLAQLLMSSHVASQVRQFGNTNLHFEQMSTNTPEVPLGRNEMHLDRDDRSSNVLALEVADKVGNVYMVKSALSKRRLSRAHPLR